MPRDDKEEMTDQRPITVVGAIIRRENKVLAARRKPEKSAGGLWEFPGGKIEGGETPEEALRRELREELDIEVSVGSIASRHVTALEGRLIDLACYWATLEGPAPSASTDHDRLEWITPDQLQDRTWSPADVPIIEDIIPES